MSNKFDENNDLLDEINQIEEQLLEEVVEQGPMPSIAPMVGTSKSVIQRYTHCDFCGGRLHFTYSTDYMRNTTNERTSCPECKLEAKQVLHRLQ
jgi:hypothetical protein